MNPNIHTTDTRSVAVTERSGFWGDCVSRLFNGLKCDTYGDRAFDGRMSTVRAGDVVLTRLEGDRHRVTRSAAQVRQSERAYLKIVAPYVGSAGVQQQGCEPGSHPTSGASTTPPTATP